MHMIIRLEKMHVSQSKSCTISLWRIYDFNDPIKSQICTCHAQLGCRDMCKWVTWLVHHFWSKIYINFYKIGLWVQKPFVEGVPDRIAWLMTKYTLRCVHVTLHKHITASRIGALSCVQCERIARPYNGPYTSLTCAPVLVHTCTALTLLLNNM